MHESRLGARRSQETVVVITQQGKTTEWQDDGRTRTVVVGGAAQEPLGGRIRRAYAGLHVGRGCGRAQRSPGSWHETQEEGGAAVRGGGLETSRFRVAEGQEFSFRHADFGAYGASQLESQEFKSAFARIPMKPEL